jgi:hypothetical protein
MCGFGILSNGLTFLANFFKIGHLVEIKLHTHTHIPTEHGFVIGPLAYMEGKVS